MMQAIPNVNRLSFVQSLELDEFPFHVGKGQRYVSDGSLVSFVSSLTGEQKQDVLDSSLLAQLAANKKYDRENDTDKWYKEYTNVMQMLGWVMQGFKFGRYKSSAASFSLSQVTLEILSALVGGEAEIVNVMKATISALAKSPEGLNLFESGGIQGKNGNFQIVPCTTDRSGQVNVAFMCFYFKANRHEDNFFFFSWKRQDITLLFSTQTCTLNEQAYAQVREAVIEKLGKRRITFVHDLDI